jgi:hypothetical protein
LHATWELKEKGVKAPWASFVKNFPEITQPFVDAIEKYGTSEKGMGEAMTGAFKGWYKDFKRRDHYDESFEEEMKSIQDSDFYRYKCFRERSAEYMVGQMCTLGGNNYFKDDPNILERPEYLGVSKRTRDVLDDFMQAREESLGIEPDESLKDIAVIEYPGVKRDSEKKQDSDKKRQARLNIRQAHARKTIREVKAAKKSVSKQFVVQNFSKQR